MAMLLLLTSSFSWVVFSDGVRRRLRLCERGVASFFFFFCFLDGGLENSKEISLGLLPPPTSFTRSVWSVSKTLGVKVSRRLSGPPPPFNRFLPPIPRCNPLEAAHNSHPSWADKLKWKITRSCPRREEMGVVMHSPSGRNSTFRVSARGLFL